MNPLTMRWDGESLHPVNKFFAGEADKELVVGERYRITTVEERSQRSHDHYHVNVREGWSNLPDHLLEQYPTAEHLRKKLLIKAGYHTEISITCASKAEALRTVMMLRQLDEYAVLIPRGDVVSIYRAKSQSLKAMGKKEFQESKTKVLNLIDDLLGTVRGTLAGREVA